MKWTNTQQYCLQKMGFTLYQLQADSLADDNGNDNLEHSQDASKTALENKITPRKAVNTATSNEVNHETSKKQPIGNEIVNEFTNSQPHLLVFHTDNHLNALVSGKKLINDILLFLQIELTDMTIINLTDQDFTTELQRSLERLSKQQLEQQSKQQNTQPLLAITTQENTQLEQPLPTIVTQQLATLSTLSTLSTLPNNRQVLWLPPLTDLLTSLESKRQLQRLLINSCNKQSHPL